MVLVYQVVQRRIAPSSGFSRQPNNITSGCIEGYFELGRGYQLGIDTAKDEEEATASQ
jgi:hypothetical protein